MRINKRTAAIAAAILTLVAACGSDTPDDSTAEPSGTTAAPATSGSDGSGSTAAPAGEDVELVVFGPSSWDTFAPGAPEATVSSVNDTIDAAFMAKFPEVTKITHDSRGTISDGLSRLTNASLAGDQVDVIMCAGNPVNTSYQPKGLIAPVDDVVAEVQSGLVEGAAEPFTIGGKVWGVPLSGVSATLFYYNKSAFQAAGVEVPATYSEFVAAAQKLREAGYTPAVHQGKNPWMWPLYWMSALAQTTGNEQLAKTKSNLAGETRFDDPQDLLAMQLVRGYMDDGILDKSSMDLDEEGMRAAFVNGKAATYLSGTWDIPILQEQVKDFEFGVFQFPQFDGQPGTPTSFGGVEVGLCLSASSKNPEYAKKYMAFAASPEMAAISLEPTKPIATSHQAVVGGTDALSTQIRDTMVPAAQWLDWLWPRELGEAVQREVQAVMGGSTSPEEAIAAIQATYDELVEDGYVYNG